MNLSISSKIYFYLALFFFIASCNNTSRNIQITEGSIISKNENGGPNEDKTPESVEDEIVEEFIDQGIEGQIEQVLSDLRKEFPKKDHIRIAKQIGVDIEEIYYYHNQSRVTAIYVNTNKVLNDKELIEIQSKIYKVLWDFNSADIKTFFKHKNEFYAILSSRKKFREERSFIVYDYKKLVNGLNERFNLIKSNDEYPFKDKKIYGVYLNLFSLSSINKSDPNKMTLDLFIEKNENELIQYDIHDDKV